MALHTFYLILSLAISIKSELVITEEDYNRLPPIYHLDSYQSCRDNGKLYCGVKIYLRPSNNTGANILWEFINKTRWSINHYDHHRLYYGLCLNNYCDPKNFENTSSCLIQHFNRKFKNLSLTTDYIDLNQRICNRTLELTLFDWITLSLGFIYVIIALIATLANTKNVYLNSFSITRNWQDLFKNNSKTNQRSLKCVDSIRFFTTFIIIFMHFIVLIFYTHIENINDIEQNYSKPIYEGIRIFFSYQVQTFFLISAWFLAYNTRKTLQKNEEINHLSLFFFTSLKRYLRLMPPIIVFTLLSNSALLLKLFDSYNLILYIYNRYDVCQKYWWHNLLFITNEKDQTICGFHLWYLSADFQLYVLSLAILLLINYFKLNLKLILISNVILSILYQSFNVYYHNVDYIFRFPPENLEDLFGQHDYIYYVYTSTISNMATYNLGLYFGNYYYDLQKDKIDMMFNNWLKNYGFWLSFLGLPILTIVLPTFKWNSRILELVLGGILKPLYALGIGIGILGLNYNQGGIARHFLVWKTFVLLGKISYSIYIAHMLVLALYCILKPEIMLIPIAALTIAACFMAGFLMYLLVESPFVQFNNLIFKSVKQI